GEPAPTDVTAPVGAGSPAKGPDLPACNPLYGKSVPWKKQRFIPSCAKSGISGDDGAENLAYPQKQPTPGNKTKGNNKIIF
ncbi:hypothetical protein, partial [Pseudomonas sp. CM25]|uniref:hypothetical protein n=1 Tax=Pseudomonas sp. CM25 TaxID=2738448 RepID=UPI001C49BD65